jgi:hypothetical protein
MRRLGLALGTACVTFLACGLAAAGPHADPPPGKTVLSAQIEGGTALFVGRADGADAVQRRGAPRKRKPQVPRTERRLGVVA